MALLILYPPSPPRRLELSPLSHRLCTAGNTIFWKGYWRTGLYAHLAASATAHTHTQARTTYCHVLLERGGL